MDKVLILGKNGQLASSLNNIGLKGRYLGSGDLDLLKSSKEEIFEAFKNIDFDTIVNCAAYTQVDKAESEKADNLKLNSEVPGYLAEYCKEFGKKLIHISTDYVFNGESDNPYSEDMACDPVNEYGRAKYLGEQAITTIEPDFVIIRGSWLYAEQGNNFVKTMIRFGNERDSLNVVEDQWGSPTYCGDFAKAIVEVIENFEHFKGETYHFSNEGKTNWYLFAKKIKEITGFKAEVNPIPTSGYPTPAKRPKFSLLSKEKIKKKLKMDIPQWDESLKTMLEKKL